MIERLLPPVVADYITKKSSRHEERVNPEHSREKSTAEYNKDSGSEMTLMMKVPSDYWTKQDTVDMRGIEKYQPF